jgi:RNA polymerase sigma-70 factor (ECF subfamily)
MVETGEHLM